MTKAFVTLGPPFALGHRTISESCVIEEECVDALFLGSPLWLPLHFYDHTLGEFRIISDPHPPKNGPYGSS